jgi:MFS family permease
MTAAALPLDDDTLFSRGRAGAAIGSIVLVSLLAFEAMAVAAAMPAIAQALDGLSLYALAFGGLLATSVLGMVVAGRLSDRHGPGGATAIGLVAFAAGLLVAGLAGSMPWLVAGRIVQGLGGGMLGVALYVGMGRLVPQRLHPRLFALFAAAWVLPALLGPPVAAWMVEVLGWRAVFLAVAAVVPLSALWLLPAFGRLPPPSPTGDAGVAPSHAMLGWAALGATGALLLYAADRATQAATMLPALGVGLVAAGTSAQRLLPRGSLVAAAGLPAVIALRGLLAAAFASAEVFVPLYLTREAGWPLAQAGLALSAGAVMWSAGSALQARLDGERQRRAGLQAGFALVAAGTAAIVAQMLWGHAAWLVVPGWMVAGFGIGMGFPMLSVLVLRLSPPAEQGRNASALQLSDALCTSAALAVAGALFGLGGVQGAAGYALVLGLAAGMAVVGVVLARRAFA